MSRHAVRAALPLAASILAWAQFPAAADGVDVIVTATSVPTFHVRSDGTKYTELVTEQNEKFRFEAQLNIEGGRDRIYHWAVAPNLRINGKRWGWTFDNTSRPPEDQWGVVTKSYGSGDRPTAVHRHIAMEVDPTFIDDFVIEACNDKADQMRTQGGSNAAIFASEHVLEPSAKFPNSVTYRSVPDLHNDPIESSGQPPLKPKIVCMKYEGPHRNVNENTQVPVAVSQATLLTIGKATAGGTCKIILSGVIETNLANAEVKFRYEHSGGQKSNVKTVKTDFTKTAMFSDEYDVPNNPNGDEIGKVRLVGESIDFQSGWSAYRMHCTAPGPGDIQAQTLPKLELTVAAGKTEMTNGQICPANLLLQALVKTGSAFDGKGLFLGNAFLTAPQPVSLGANQVKHLFANRDLDWDSGGNFAGTLTSSSGSPSSLKSQKVRIGFNLADASGKVVGQVPQQWYTVTCRKPALNPDVSQGSADMVSQPSGRQ
jgi:hypothetical protein